MPRISYLLVTVDKNSEVSKMFVTGDMYLLLSPKITQTGVVDDTFKVGNTLEEVFSAAALIGWELITQINNPIGWHTLVFIHRGNQRS